MRAGGGACAAALVAVLAGAGGCGLAGQIGDGGRGGAATRAPAQAHSAAPAEPTGVRGRVMRVQGAPGAHCLLEARPHSPAAPPMPETAALSDARGRYFWTLPEATYTVSARCGAAQGSVEGVEVVAGRVVHADIVVE